MRGMGIVPQPSGAYYVWVMWNKKKIWIRKDEYGNRMFDIKGQCDTVLNKVANQIKKGQFDPSQWGKKTASTIEVGWQNYQAEYPCSSATHEERERIYRIYLEPYFRGKSFRDISDAVAKDWFRVTGEKVRTPSYMRTITAILKAFLRSNVRELPHGTLPIFPKCSVPRKDKPFLEANEQELVLEFIPPQHQGIIRFLIAYGCRSSEACKLERGNKSKPGDIDWTKRLITFRERKAKDQLTMPILPQIEEYLVGGSGSSVRRCLGPISGGSALYSQVHTVEPQAEQGKMGPDRDKVETEITDYHPTNIKYIFCRMSGKPYTRQVLYALWTWANRKANKKYGIKILPLKNATRHSMGSQLANKGYDALFISRVLGNTPAVAAKNYVTITPERVGQVLELRKVQNEED